jgi:hypothetical protein
LKYLHSIFFFINWMIPSRLLLKIFYVILSFLIHIFPQKIPVVLILERITFFPI